MIITYHQRAFIKAQMGETIVAFNPISKQSTYPTTRFAADLALVSTADKDYNGVDLVSGGQRELFVIDGAGEYERDNNFIRGLWSTGPGGKLNAIYVVVFDDFRLCHLGALADDKLAPETLEQLGAIDVLFLPIGGGPVLAPKAAAQLASSLAPKLVIPVHYDDAPAALDVFLKEMGVRQTEAVERLSLKRKELEGKETETVIIKPS